MNLNLKAIYFCHTSKNTWGKGLTIAEAKKNAGITTKKDEKSRQFYVWGVILNEPNQSELSNLFACIVASEIDGNPEYYKSERTQEDDDMINKFHVGWLIIEKNFD